MAAIDPALPTPQGVRARNRLKVVQALHANPGSSRAAVLELTGLSRPTLAKLLDELEAAGIVEETAPEETARRGSGRPPGRLALAPHAGFAVGVDVGHAHIRVAVCDLAGGLVADDFSVAQVDHAPEESLDLARELVNGVLRTAGVDVERVVGVGMGIAAPVNPQEGTIHSDGILPSWAGLKPAEELGRRLGLPVRLDNDANVGARGEHAFGVARGVRDVLYVRLSSGIGLGLVLDGRPYRGATGIAGELGHVRVREDGLVCRCGNRGCLETVATPAAVADLLERSRGRPVGPLEVAGLARDGDRGAQRAVGDAGASVGQALATVVNVLNPAMVVVGGELVGAGGHLLDPLRATLRELAVAPAADAAEVVAGTLGERAEVLGAAEMILAHAPRLLIAN